MTTFDGSTEDSGRGEVPLPADHLPASEPFDALAMLRESVDEREGAAERTITVDIPGLSWRLVCAIDFTYAQFKKWQMNSLPVKKRRTAKVSPFDLNQAVLAREVLINTCEGMEFLHPETREWTPLVDGNDQPMTLTSSATMARFNVVDPRELVWRIFGRMDAHLIKASEEVAIAAGYIEGDSENDGEVDGEVDPLG